MHLERKWVFVKNIGEKEDGNPKNKMEALEKLVWVLSHRSSGLSSPVWPSVLVLEHEQVLQV